MNTERKQVAKWLRFYILILVLSGISALPVEKELEFLISQFPSEGSIKGWLKLVLKGVSQANQDYPFLFYGYDWLAFAHFMLAILFIGPLLNPVKNKWVIEFGMISCVLIIPFALVAGQIRGIPVWWRIIDCSFGAIGFIPLLLCLQKINLIEKKEKQEVQHKEQFELLVA